MNLGTFFIRACVASAPLILIVSTWADDRTSTPTPMTAEVNDTMSKQTGFPPVDLIPLFPVLSLTTAVPSVPPTPSPENNPNKWQFALYPVLGWAPLFRANTDFSVPSFPGGGSGSGSTNWSINGAALFGADIVKSGWVFEAEGMWASVSAARQNPYVNIGTNADYADLFIGHKVWKDISVLAGFRRMAVDMSATVTDFPTVSRKPGVWDPLIALDWRRRFGRKLFVQIRLDGGGFGVGSDVDVDGEARVEWRFAKHFGILGGYEALHYQISGTLGRGVAGLGLQHPWQLRQTFNGPLMGFGIYF